MIDTIVRKELATVQRVMECCDHAIVGTGNMGNYFVSIERINAMKGLSNKTKKDIGQYSEVINYKEGYFVIMPYATLFKYLSGADLNACS